MSLATYKADTVRIAASTRCVAGLDRECLQFRVPRQHHTAPLLLRPNRCAITPSRFTGPAARFATLKALAVVAADPQATLDQIPHAVPDTTATGLRAVVVGAGLAGLTTAQALRTLFDEVVVIEKDPVSTEPHGATLEEALGKQRHGVPQFAQPHVMLRRGLNILRELVPDYDAKMLEAGAVKVNWMVDQLGYNFGRYTPRQKVEGYEASDALQCTRSLYEGVMRREVALNENVHFVSGEIVSGLLFNADRSAVTGLKLKSGVELEATLVVDASGRNSAAPKWLEEGGYQAPPAVSVSANLGYGTQLYEFENYTKDYKMCVIFASPPDNRNGILLPVEGNKYQLILTGYNGDHPPADQEGFFEFAKSLAKPDIYNLIKDAKPLTPVLRYLRTENIRRKYDEVDMPDGFALLGDAVCAFNPVYGQGMTVGMEGAVLLTDLVRGRLAAAGNSIEAKKAALAIGLTKEFQKKLVDVLATPWAMATGEDQRRSGKAADVGVSPVQKLVAEYLLLLQEMSLYDARTQLQFHQVFGLVDKPTVLFAPGMLLKAMRFLLMKRLGRIDTSNPGQTPPPAPM